MASRREAAKNETPAQKRKRVAAEKVVRVVKQKMEIVERLSSGEPLAQMCRDNHLPSPTSVREWMSKDEQFSVSIACAREDGEDFIAADCLKIADEGSNDYMATQEGGGADAYRLNGEHIQRSKLRIDTRLKLLAKWNPKKYGERMVHQGDSGSDPVSVKVSTPELTSSINKVLQAIKGE